MGVGNSSTGLSSTTVLPGQTVTFKAEYSSPANIAPSQESVMIDGTAYSMTPPSGTPNYRQGAIYTYSTSTLSPGEHQIQYTFANKGVNGNGSDTATFEISKKLKVTPIMTQPVSSPVSPTSGTSTTPFTFSTTFLSGDGTAPSSALVYIDNKAYNMTCVAPCNSSTGATFQEITTLPPGNNHTFYFVFTTSDSSSSWAEPFAPTLYGGPNVGANAKPVPPGTVIIPASSIDPDAQPEYGS